MTLEYLADAALPIVGLTLLGWLVWTLLWVAMR